MADRHTHAQTRQGGARVRACECAHLDAAPAGVCVEPHVHVVLQRDAQAVHEGCGWAGAGRKAQWTWGGGGGGKRAPPRGRPRPAPPRGPPPPPPCPRPRTLTRAGRDDVGVEDRRLVLHRHHDALRRKLGAQLLLLALALLRLLGRAEAPRALLVHLGAGSHAVCGQQEHSVARTHARCTSTGTHTRIHYLPHPTPLHPPHPPMAM